MKETVKINLSQRLFDLDADAFLKLREYLDSLARVFGGPKDEADEILQDIEQRIADILSEKLGATKQVITINDINEIIAILGTPDDFARDTETTLGEEEKDNQGTGRGNSNENKYNSDYRRLHRDEDNKVIAGVCSGLSKYFNIDLVWVRLIFIAAVIVLPFAFIGIITYIVIWISVPVARTTAQKLQMQGKPVNAENIKDSVKSEFNKAKENVNNYSKTGQYRRAQHSAANFFSSLASVILVIAKVFIILIGIFFIMFIVGLVFGTFSVLPWVFHGLHFPFRHNLHLGFPPSHGFPFFHLAVLIVVLVPVAGIFTALFKFIFGIKTRNHILAAFAWTAWVLALLFVIYSFVADKEQLPLQSYSKQEEKIEFSPNRTLYVRLKEEKNDLDGTDHLIIFNKEIVRNKEHDKYWIKPTLKIKWTGAGKSIRLTRKTTLFTDFGHDKSDKLQTNAWTISDTTLLINEYFMYDENKMWKLPRVELCLTIPNGQRIVLSDGLRAILNKEGDNPVYPEAYFNTQLMMINNKLRPVKALPE